jgi:hypothetical protein
VWVIKAVSSSPSREKKFMDNDLLQAELQRGIGDNSADAEIRIEVRVFNSLARYISDHSRRCDMALLAGSIVADILSQLEIPENQVFLVLCNG